MGRNAERLSQTFKDVSAFGLRASLKAMLRKFGRGVLELNIRDFGLLAIRRGDSDFSTIRQTLRDKQYYVKNATTMRRLRDRVDQICNSGGVPVIVDAGANIGVASIWFASVFPEAHLVAIEPDIGNCEILQKNCAAHPRITVVEAAIGARDGFVKVVNAGQSWGATTQRADSGCPVVTVEQAVNMVDDGVLLMVKIDIEGFESELFEEHVEWIDETVAIFVEPHDWLFCGKGTSRSFQRAMGARDFELHITGENLLYVNRAQLGAPKLTAA